MVSCLDLGPSSTVGAWLVRSREGSELPRRVESRAFGVQVRLLDRFYLPEALDEAVVRALFDTVATVYDRLTRRPINIETAAHLLSRALEHAGEDPLLLDLGCGTGLAIEAAAILGRRCRLIGTDVSGAMLAVARARGETVMGINEWRARPPTIDGAIACFVLHYGVTEEDLCRLAASLRPGAVFAANLFRMSEQSVANIERLLQRLGLSAAPMIPIGATGSNNLLASFRKRP